MEDSNNEKNLMTAGTKALPRSWSVKSNGEPLLELGAGSWKDLGSMGKRLTLLWLRFL